MPYDNFTPIFTGGLGGVTENVNSRFDISGNWFPKVQGGLGLEYIIGNNVGVYGSALYNYILSDNIDLVEQGKYNDFYWSINIGLNFYLGKNLGDKKFNFTSDKK